ncbi:conserved hypothetical protein [Pediculus humanus corporis]|uniref:E3 ubiquitin-protein ligase MARCHF5 n=1 Tax=Pediculus humanus subsp. corporis TaxID=121224 RepID=E0V9S6_PEDHC|nr:uncharacterized protein Phum_PHUM020190 [Pediculus humanus corporis]EEB10132.1 conserved hypothetical protein [Pediculus humanus corporis]
MGSSNRNDPQILETQIPIRQEEDAKQCWVCFSTETDDPNALWVRPCKCKGTAKWVHQLCLQRWVDEKQKGNYSGKVSCPQCNTEYIIVYPKMGPLIVILDSFNAVVFKVCPIIAAGVVVGSIYWVAVSYGAITVMQIMGQENGLDLMENADPLMLLVGLPIIPVALILSKLINWEDTALTFLRRNARKVPVLKYILPFLTWYSVENNGQSPAAVPPLNDPISATRVLCSALILPTMATITGGLLFRSVQSNVQRTFLGGIAFLTIKGILKLYYKQQHYIRQCKRKILDFPTASSPNSTPTRPTARQDIIVETGNS